MWTENTRKLERYGRHCSGAMIVFFGYLQRLGPYLLLELVLPGGTLFALSLYVYRHKRPALLAIFNRVRLKDARNQAA